ncbi:helix-turn-helix domain-containing protein [Rhodococcus xishaensis]|uniref:Helix-turn-helix domain-containing protein n=1 Tax=Rhodococcus xishaensis TaxID=2487364 RepID=A0A3S3BJT7_9NOCA|nr:helix-turn-helix domain-containing protein [Rhodococcus xishaensis]RVW03035.1 helix-turn-helix domain-containing protein [Rhodococcus xishaensis]
MDPLEPHTTGSVIQALRTKRGVTQRELAVLAVLSPHTIQSLELNRRPPKEEVVDAIVEALRLDIGEENYLRVLSKLPRRPMSTLATISDRHALAVLSSSLTITYATRAVEELLPGFGEDQNFVIWVFERDESRQVFGESWAAVATLAVDLMRWQIAATHERKGRRWAHTLLNRMSGNDAFRSRWERDNFSDPMRALRTTITRPDGGRTSMTMLVLDLASGQTALGWLP